MESIMSRRWHRRPEKSLPLFDQQGRSSTSRAAARNNVPHAAAQRERLLAAIVAAGDAGMTADELQQALSLPPQSVTPRMLELRRAGLVVDAGRTRATCRGRQAKVYIARGS